MARDAIAEFLVRQASSMVAPDGQLDLLDVVDQVAHVRYTRHLDPACAECTVSDADLLAWLREMFTSRAAHIKDIELETTDA